MAKRAETLARSAEDHYEIGRLYHEIGEVASASAAYMNADRLKYEPRVVLYASIAECYFALGDNRIGRKYLEWALKFAPGNKYAEEVRERSGETGIPE
jgi:tetratricopeptide (TPR) repeat protein